jgi:Glycosyl transferases group 1
VRSIAVTGFSPHTEHLCRLLNQHSRDIDAASYGETHVELLRAAMRASKADAMIQVGGPRANELLQRILESRRRPVIVLWVGTDVMAVAKVPAELERVRVTNVVHWAVAPHLVDELGALGIAARHVPIASAPVPETISPLPQAFTVLSYLPEPSREFYGQRYIWEAAKALPDVSFFVVGRGKPERRAPPNVVYLGYVPDMNARIDASSVLVRLTPHDGLSLGVVEALARGRHVIWTHPYPGVIHAPSPIEAIEALSALREAHAAGTLRPNEAGIRVVASQHGATRIASGLSGALEDVIDQTKRAIPGRRAERKVAISGPLPACVRVTANCRKYSHKLWPLMLLTASRTDRLISLIDLLRSDAWYAIGQPIPPALFDLAASVSGKRRIIHWIRSEDSVLNSCPSLIRKFKGARFEHFAQTEEIAERLRNLGLRPQVAPVATVARPERAVQPFPTMLTLLLFATREKPDPLIRTFYERLMRAFAAEPVRYIIAGGGQLDVPRGVSLETVGWRYDLRSVYDRSTAFVRLFDKDLDATTLVEALLRGRYVLTSEEFPFTERITTYESLELSVRALLQRHSVGRLVPQMEAAQTMSALYSPERCLNALANACAPVPLQ